MSAHTHFFPEVLYMGRVPFKECLDFMMEKHRLIAEDPTYPEHILVVEHPPTVTMGNRYLPEDMYVSPEILKTYAVDFYKIDRGGSVTVHEPGQVVIYPLIRLATKGLTVKRFVWSLEEAMIQTCKTFGVEGARDAINPGVWCGMNKIGALGIRIENKVSRHGLAFNVNNSLSTFHYIIPCGIRGRGVTTLLKECKDPDKIAQITFDNVAKILTQNLLEILAAYR